MINGILNIYKEKGYTSHDVVARLRGIVGQKKIGHTGTLDPEAEGVLPVCLGRATRVCDMLTDKDKVYETVLLLGKVTDTQDITGRVLLSRSPDDPELPSGAVTAQKAEDCIRGFIGGYDQIPPMYSAVKVNGKKLYELAREGRTVERKSRRVMIYDIRIRDISLPRVRMEVECSKGTYIRTLCHDIGEKLGCGGCMEKLLRTRVGQFPLAQSRKLDEVERLAKEGRLSEILIPADRLFHDLDKLCLRKRYDLSGYNGNPLERRHFMSAAISALPEQPENMRFRIYDSMGNFIGIYYYDRKKDRFCPEKMFFDPEQIRQDQKKD